jgi:hypothetical protein
MVFAETGTKVLVPARVRILVILVHVDLLWVLLGVGHVLGSGSALENGIGGLGLLLPEEFLAEANGELGFEHLAASGSRREGGLVRGGGGPGDGLG